MFSSISSCGTLRFAPCKVALHGRGPCLIAFLLVAAFPVGPPPKLQKTARCPKVPYKEFSSAVAESIFQFLGLWALLFFILALHAFISFHFGLLGLYFAFSASILGFGASILPLWALRGGILWLFVAFWAFGGGYPFALCGFLSLQGGIPHNFGPPTAGSPPTTCQKRPVFLRNIQRIYQRRGLGLEGGYPLALCGLLGLRGGHPFALYGFLSLQGGILHNFGPPTVGPPPTSCQKRSVFPRSHTKNLSAPWPTRFSNFWACGR